MLNRNLIQLSADGWGCAPSPLVAFPNGTSPPRFYRGVNDNIQKGKKPLPWVLPPVPPPCGEPLLTNASTGGPGTLAGRSSPVSCGVTAPFSWVLVCTWFCLCQEWSLYFPQSCGSRVIKSCWPSKSDSLGTASSFVGSPGWKAWHLVTEPSQQ